MTKSTMPTRIAPNRLDRLPALGRAQCHVHADDIEDRSPRSEDPWQSIPRDPLVLLADGLSFEFNGIPWVLYLMALKPRSSSQATFLDPVLLPGRQGTGRWQKAPRGLFPAPCESA